MATAPPSLSSGELCALARLRSACIGCGREGVTSRCSVCRTPICCDACRRLCWRDRGSAHRRACPAARADAVAVGEPVGVGVHPQPSPNVPSVDLKTPDIEWLAISGGCDQPQYRPSAQPPPPARVIEYAIEANSRVDLAGVRWRDPLSGDSDPRWWVMCCYLKAGPTYSRGIHVILPKRTEGAGDKTFVLAVNVLHGKITGDPSKRGVVHRYALGRFQWAVLAAVPLYRTIAPDEEKEQMGGSPPEV